MGEIADMMLDGILDEQTGEYLGGACGYPRTLVKGQYNTIRDHTEHNATFQHNALHGLCKWLKNYGIKNDEEKHKLIREYAALINFIPPKKRTYVKTAVEIQKDFTKFTKFVKDKYESRNTKS